MSKTKTVHKKQEVVGVSVRMTGDHYSMTVAVDVPVVRGSLSTTDFDGDEWWEEPALTMGIELIKSYYGWDLQGTIIDVDFEKL